MINLFLALLFLTLPLAADRYCIKMVGPRSPCSWVSSINDQGQVVGSYVNSKKEMRHFFWSESRGFIDLGVNAYRSDDLEYPDLTYIFDTRGPIINNHSLVAGRYVKGGLQRLFVWTPTSKLQDLDFEERYGSCKIMDINNLNQVLINHNDVKLYLWKEGKKELLPIRYKECCINDVCEIHGLEENIIWTPRVPDPNEPDDVITEIGNWDNKVKLYDLRCGKCVSKPVSFAGGLIDFNNHSVGLWGNRFGTLIWEKGEWSRTLANFLPVALNDRGEILGYRAEEPRIEAIIDDEGMVRGYYPPEFIKEIPLLIDGSKTHFILDEIEPGQRFEDMRVYALNNQGDIAGAICIRGVWRAAILEKIINKVDR